MTALLMISAKYEAEVAVSFHAHLYDVLFNLLSFRIMFIISCHKDPFHGCGSDVNDRVTMKIEIFGYPKLFYNGISFKYCLIDVFFETDSIYLKAYLPFLSLFKNLLTVVFLSIMHYVIFTYY